MAKVVFDYADFILRYPEFANYSNQSNITNIFAYEVLDQGQFLIGLFPSDDAKRLYWYDLILAHILYCAQNQIPGRPSSTGQGSDSVTYENPTINSLQEWTVSPYGRRVYRLLRSFALGGLYIPSGNTPFNSNSMNGAYSLDYYGW